MGIKPWATTNSAVWTAPSGAVVTGLVDADNPLAIRPYTMRFQFSDSSYDPTSESWVSGSFWTQVSSSPNVWDFTYVSNNWGGYSSSVTVFGGRFQNRNNLVSVLGGNLFGVEDGSYMFRDCTALRSVQTFDTSSMTSIVGMFSNCSAINSIALLNTSSALSMREFLKNCSQLTTVPLFDTSSATTFDEFLYGCSSLTTVPLFDTSSAIRLTRFLYGCSSLTTVPLFDTSSATNLSFMLSNCSSLTSIPLFDTSSSTDMRGMLSRCTALTSVPLFNTSLAIDMSEMLENCTSLTSIPLFNTNNATHVDSMCASCLNVENGALDLYTQMSSQVIVPSTHAHCFEYCGSYTASGSAELAQIPSDWK